MLRESPVFTTIPCTSLDKCRPFYEETLGLSPSSDVQLPGGVVYDCGRETKIFLYETTAPKGGHTLCSFICDDLDREMSDLRSRGARFEEYESGPFPTEHGVYTDPQGNRNCWIKDPEGNILAITEVKAMAKRAAA